jgi:hypothetical protein
MHDPLGWLGLKPDADERAVKRAYAARLKTTRPEDNPEGFAQLVAARDAALRLVKQRAEAAEAETFRYRPIDVAALARLAAAFPGASVAAAPAPRAEPAPPVETAMDRLGRAVNIAEALLAGPTPADADGWHLVFDLADTLPLALRGRLEQRLAEVVNRALPTLTAPDGAGEAAATAIVTRVGEDFGWLTATRRVAGLFWPPDGRQPLPQFIERMLSRVPPPGRDENGIPVLDRFDLDAFFGGEAHRSVTFYERARRRGRFGWSWTPLAFVSPTGWAMQDGWYSAAALLLFVGLLLAPSLPATVEDLETSEAAVALGLLLALHVGIALAADRLAILRLVWHRRRADRVSAYRDAARRRHLARKAQRSRAAVVIAALLFFFQVDFPPAVALVRAVSLLWQGA